MRKEEEEEKREEGKGDRLMKNEPKLLSETINRN